MKDPRGSSTWKLVGPESARLSSAYLREQQKLAKNSNYSRFGVSNTVDGQVVSRSLYYHSRRLFCRGRALGILELSKSVEKLLLTFAHRPGKLPMPPFREVPRTASTIHHVHLPLRGTYHPSTLHSSTLGRGAFIIQKRRS